MHYINGRVRVHHLQLQRTQQQARIPLVGEHVADQLAVCLRGLYEERGGGGEEEEG